MLRIDLREVRAGPVDTRAQLAVDDPLFEGTELSLAAPVRVSGCLNGVGEGKYYWQARVETVVRGECRRCLEIVERPLSQPVAILFTSEVGAEEAEGCYPIPRQSAVLDLSGAVREELVLAAPAYLVCAPECQGLCPNCGANLNAGPCSCERERDPRWEALRALTEGPPPGGGRSASH